MCKTPVPPDQRMKPGQEDSKKISQQEKAHLAIKLSEQLEAQMGGDYNLIFEVLDLAARVLHPRAKVVIG